MYSTLVGNVPAEKSLIWYFFAGYLTTRFNALVIALSLLRSWAICNASPPSSQASFLQLEADRRAVDFGVVSVDSEHHQVVTLRNPTTQTIRLLGTKADCDCLSSYPEVSELRPGGLTRWHIVLNTCDYIGEVRKHASVMTDQRELPELKIDVRYRVVPALFADPGIVSVGLMGHEPIETLVEIRTCEDREFRLLSASTTDASLEAILEQDAVSVHQPGLVRLCVQPPSAEGPIQIIVWVRTDDPKLDRVRIPVIGEYVPGLRADRRQIDFGMVQLGPTARETITFDCESGVELREVRVTGDGIRLEGIDRTKSRVALSLETLAELPLGSFQGYVTVEVVSGRSRRIRLPYSGCVIEPPVQRRS